MRGSNAKRGPLSLAVFVAVIGVGLGSEGDTAASEDSMKLIVPKGLIDHKAMTKVNPSLGTLYQEYQAWRSSVAPDSRTVFRSKNPLIRLSDGYVVIDAVASGDAEQLRTDLEGLGMKNAAVYGRMVSGRLPITAIKALESLESLKSIRPATARTNTGAVNRQGAAALRSDEARITLGVDGTGIRVGTLSDSFNCLGGAAAGVLSGDLPAGINVVQEISNCAEGMDEGRAMMELIHDVAPAATQDFHTAFDGQADFAQGILDLHKAGAKVIVDDVIYLAEPMFQDGSSLSRWIVSSPEASPTSLRPETTPDSPTRVASGRAESSYSPARPMISIPAARWIFGSALGSRRGASSCRPCSGINLSSR